MLHIASSLLSIDWSDFFVWCACIFIGTTLIYSYIPNTFKKDVFNASAINRNGLVLYLSLFAILYFTLVFVNWYSFDWGKYGGRIILIKYLVGILIFAGISTVFSILNYILHVVNSKAHVINTDIFKYINQKREKFTEREQHHYNDTEREMKLFLEKINDVEIIDYLSADETIMLLNGRHKFDDDTKINCIKFKNTECYFISILRIYHVSDSIRESKVYEILLDGRFTFIDTKMNHHRSAQGIKSYIEEQIKKINTIILPTLAEANTQLPIGIFIQSFLMEIFSLKQTYITPISSTARLLYLVFGIYKFLFLGTFISLLVK